MNNSEDHLLLVAELPQNNVVAVVYLKKHRSLFVETSLEVGGLVVDKAHRSKGIGRLLMQKAEDIAKEWNIPFIRLTSNIKRVKAHKFYRELGYDQPKTSHYFIKTLLTDSPRQ